MTRRVALFKQTIKHPVTFGSNVPEWPVFSTLKLINKIMNTRKIFLTHATISWELGLDGLSRFITPYFKYSYIGLFNGVELTGIGV